MTLSIILIRPQMGENIGAAARVMANFGLRDLRVVAPRDGWPSEAAEAMAAGSPVLEQARVYETTEAALADLHTVYATAAFSRAPARPITTPRPAVAELVAQAEAGQGVGVIFGPERAGLANADMDLCAKVISIPVDPEFNSLNLAQAVAVMGYEWQMHQSQAPVDMRQMPEPAALSDLHGLFGHLEGELDAARFFFPPEKREGMVRNLRAMLARAQLSAQEVRTLRGMIRALVDGPRTG